MRAWVLAQTEAVHPQYFPLSVTALKSILKSYCLSYHNITFPLICPIYFNTFYIVSAKSHGSEFCDLNTYFISFVCSLFLEPSFLIVFLNLMLGKMADSCCPFTFSIHSLFYNATLTTAFFFLFAKLKDLFLFIQKQLFFGWND